VTRSAPTGRVLAGLTLVLAIAGCGDAGAPATDPASFKGQPPKVRVHMISRDLSRMIGERGYAELIESLELQERLETNARLQQRVEVIANRLVHQAIQAYPFSQDWSWELRIVKDDEINASCMPGGKMTLNTGLMALTRMDEHKLATVLGHEIAHALLEHGRASIGRSAVVLGTLQAMAQSFKMGQLRLNTLVEGMERVTLPLEREHEREADLLGMQLMTRAGYDPVRGASIWIDMKGDEPAPRLAQRLEPYVSSHPTSDERLTNLTEIARVLATPGGPAR
jgi:predicted Zn-dependent protease